MGNERQDAVLQQKIGVFGRFYVQCKVMEEGIQ